MPQKKNTIEDINRKKPLDSLLTAIEFREPKLIKDGKREPRKRVIISCRCKCGNVKDYSSCNVINGSTKSCGCFTKTFIALSTKRHGLCNHQLYKTWDCMKQRCYNPNFTGFEYWGGKGVVICEEWKCDFKAFFDWAINNGWQDGLQLDKDIKAKELGLPPLLYSPERCQFVTPATNSRARDNTVILEHDGRKLSISEWAEVLSIPPSTIRQRHARGKNTQQMLNTKYTPKPKNK